MIAFELTPERSRRGPPTPSPAGEAEVRRMLYERGRRPTKIAWMFEADIKTIRRA